MGKKKAKDRMGRAYVEAAEEKKGKTLLGRPSWLRTGRSSGSG